MSVDLKFVFRLSKQTLNNVSIHLKAYLSRFIDEIIILNTMAFLDIVKRGKKCIKLIKKKEVKVIFILVILTNNEDNAKEKV